MWTIWLCLEVGREGEGEKRTVAYIAWECNLATWGFGNEVHPELVRKRNSSVMVERRTDILG